MLQIITGKFFDERKINQSEVSDILYSNMALIANIETNIVTMKPVSHKSNAINGYVIQFTNKYQPVDEKDPLYMPIHDTITYQYKLILTLWFRSFFHQEKEVVERSCNKLSGTLYENYASQDFIEDYFDLRTITNDEVEKFKIFFEKVLLLERSKYNLFVRCLGGFYNSIELFHKNYDLAYSLLVYTLESLITETYNYKPIWKDYDQNIRTRLEPVLDQLDLKQSEQIKAIIIEGQNFKLKQRFIDGFIKMLGEDYFTPKSENKIKHIPLSELRKALENLYTTRSLYVHKLDNIDPGSKLPEFAKQQDYFHKNRQPYLTMAGIVRLTRTVLINFVNSAEKIEKETYNWRAEIPGIITAELAPQLWVWNTKGFKPEHSIIKFNGFLEHLIEYNELIKINDLLSVYQIHFNKKRNRYFPPMFALYCIYSILTSEENKPEDSMEVINALGNRITNCHICYLVMQTILASNFPWDADEMKKTYTEYMNTKYQKNQINLPTKLEIAILAMIANKHLLEQNVSKYELTISEIIPECVNYYTIMKVVDDSRRKKSEISIREILI